LIKIRKRIGTLVKILTKRISKTELKDMIKRKVEIGLALIRLILVKIETVEVISIGTGPKDLAGGVQTNSDGTTGHLKGNLTFHLVEVVLRITQVLRLLPRIKHILKVKPRLGRDL